MNHRILAFIPEDRRNALARNRSLPIQQIGTVLFADISGSTRLTDALIETVGATQAVDRLTTLINGCFSALIAQVQSHRGAVIGFGGDGFLAVFPNDSGVNALSCAFQLQQAMAQFPDYTIDDVGVMRLALKVAVAYGSYYRLCAGDPAIQRLEVAMGPAVQQVSALQRITQADQVMIDSALWQRFGSQLQMVPSHPTFEQPSFGISVGTIVTGWSTLPSSGPDSDVVAQVPSVAIASMVTPPSLDPTITRQWLAAPVYARLQQGSGDFLAEIRPVTVLFLDFSGLEINIVEKPNATELQEELHRFVSWVQQVLARHNGYLLKLTFDDKGSYGVITFGAPHSAHGDTARALAAALELGNPPPDYRFTKAVTIGIHRGRLLAGAFGHANRSAYDLLGSAVNHCSRYMMAAEPGQILLSREVVADAGDVFQTQPLRTTHFKGIPEPVVIYTLQGHQPSVFTMPDAIVGRERELAELNRWFQQCCQGQGQIVLIEGPAGIGKSHLVGEFTQRARMAGAVCAIGICDYVGRSIPYYPWRSVMEQLVSMGFTRGRLSHEQQMLLTELLELQTGFADASEPLSTPREPQRRQEAIFELVSDIIIACAAAQPVVIVIEDLYYCDPVSLDLLRVVSRLVPDHDLLLLLVQHPDSPTEKSPLRELRQQPYFQMMPIGELPTAGIAAIVTARLQGEAEPLLLDLIHHQAEGNPLHAEEFTLALRDLGYLDYWAESTRYTVNAHLMATLRAANSLEREEETGLWRLRPEALLSTTDLGLPDILHELVNIRVDQIADALTPTLYIAALLGQRFTSSLLAAAHVAEPTTDLIDEQLAQLVAHALLIQSPGVGTDDSYVFRHNLVQKVIYEKVPEQQKRSLHVQIGKALELLQPDAVEQLAFHYARTDQDEKAVHYLVASARKSRAEFANEAALNFYEQALHYEEWLEWQVAKVELLHQLGRHEEERATLDLLAAQADQLSFRYPYLCATYDEATGQYESAQYLAEQALQDAYTHNDPLHQAMSLLLLGLIARRKGDYTQAIRLHEKAIAFVEAELRATAQGAAVAVDLYIGMSNILRQQSKYEGARTHCHRALVICDEQANRRGRADAISSLGIIAYYTREFATARQHHQQALQIRRAIGDLRGEGISLYNLALVDYEEGALDRAMERLDQATAIQRAADNPWEEVNIINLASVLHYHLGNFDRAQVMLQQGLTLSDQLMDRVGRAYLLCNLGQVLRDDGQLTAAARILRESIGIAEESQERYLIAMGMSHLALTRLHEGKDREAIVFAKKALQIREELELYELTTIDLTTLAQAYQHLEQSTHACTSIELAQQLLTDCAGVGPEFPHWDYYHCYAVRWWLGEEEAAIAMLTQAFQPLMKWADAIQNPAARQAFLTKVPMNRKIVSAAEHHGLAD